MPRYRHPPLTLADVFDEGPPVLVRHLVEITGLSRETVSNDIRLGHLHACRRDQSGRSRYFVPRAEARRWLTALGFLRSRAS
jgi:hypothetical protein